MSWPAQLCSAVGLISLSGPARPHAGSVYRPYGLRIIYAIGGGLIEVLISPIVEACPTKRKKAAMGLLHSFYCWGHAAVILLSTLFFTVFGISNWRILACLWAIVPLFNAVYFTQVPISSLNEDGSGMPVRELFRTRMFWFMIILMICAGACEQGITSGPPRSQSPRFRYQKRSGTLQGRAHLRS